ncbi:UDP-glucose/GDP-mannose dehydrogenase family, NAD-binding domain protein (macronuclear) [Tetrahymena thermophila SB210]|uniref:UDP-glucose/GDP-mannose dehydrogenase family, NAD-binding domain protein n=1 Tax=Tetrahymena thermophila (strain SB210) TaxID=312017 RepID=W7X4Q1_TETTS|nr:UDP-glucose/GDP-mannose dehydrogenase family, NAD-binding domain protein [Tetrahymena thermophila SB210]EWS72392.1 UDP-glucose/GDP-mannose dehydrogenase family, NAD-binding domain protein [Tetrahymena thermophila SB210]|eukprot:XP_012655076.1 UDP-glucose/GDP-mannose dehydrogenase family, NAD-binding domain protein [Tetrahymena thermophila SB210]
MQGQDHQLDSASSKNRVRLNSSNQKKEKKEVYISESAMSQFSNQRNNLASKNYGNHSKHLSSTEQNSLNYQSSTKGTISRRTSQEQSNGGFQSYSASQNTSPQNHQKGQTMKRLRLMKTAIYENGSHHETNGGNAHDNKGLFIQIDRKFDLKNSSVVEQKDPKWAECKIIGSNIQSRSRSSICSHNGYLYVYGGYELTAGPLGDFWRINLSSEQYIWEKVKVKGKVNPGLKSRHTSQVFKDKMYLFGGQHGASLSSNEMWSFDFKTETWSLVVNLGKSDQCPPSVDSHSSVLIGNKMYTMFGYFSDYGQLSNSVYEFNFDTMCWTNKFKHQPNAALDEKKSSTIPKGRLESSITYIKSQPQLIYAFGGCDGFTRLNDLWVFNIQTCMFQLIQPKNSTIPKIRSGHQLFSTQDQIVLLGGIHDITWELDDLCIFDTQSQIWTIVDQDSARRREIVNQSSLSPDSQKRNSGEPNQFRSRSKKKGQTSFIQSPKRGSNASPQQRKSYQRSGTFSQVDKDMFNDDESKNSASPGLGSPTKLLEKKRKEFQQQKAHMLQIFEVNGQEEDKFKDLSPTSEAMKNSLFVIGNPMPHLKIRQGKLTDFGRVTVSRFLEPLNDSNNVRQGKKPCARDGHRVIDFGQDKILLFGGDRHNMSFNDIYYLDLNKLQEKYKQLLNK